MDSFPTVDGAVEYLNSVLLDAVIPKTSSTLHTRPVPWWSTALHRAYLEKRSAILRY